MATWKSSILQKNRHRIKTIRKTYFDTAPLKISQSLTLMQKRESCQLIQPSIIKPCELGINRVVSWWAPIPRSNLVLSRNTESSRIYSVLDSFTQCRCQPTIYHLLKIVSYMVASTFLSTG